MKRASARGLQERPYQIYSATNSWFPSHIHSSYEVLRVLRGEATAILDGEEYRLTAGECLAVFPLETHSYTVDEQSKIVVYLFSPDYLPEFDRRAAELTPLTHRLSGEGVVFPDRHADPLAIKGGFCLLGAALLEGLTFRFRTGSAGPLSLLDEILLFVEQNYDNDCDLTDLAGALNYDYTYLSKFFKQRTGMPFHEYVARFRIGRAVYLLTDSDRSVGEIAFAVGFRSIRTFNRAFQVLFHTTPNAYRRADRP